MIDNKPAKKRRKIDPLDMIEQTNIKQHRAIIGALNDLVDDYDTLELIPGPKGEKGATGEQGPPGEKGEPGEQGLPGIVEDVTVESVEGLSEVLDRKQDKLAFDKNLHFGEISVNSGLYDVEVTMDAINTDTGEITPISFTIPSALSNMTTERAGVMTANNVYNLNTLISGMGSIIMPLVETTIPSIETGLQSLEDGKQDKLTFATEEEAIGGTDNTTLMTPLRVDQAFNEKFKVIDGVLNVFENGEWVEYVPK